MNIKLLVLLALILPVTFSVKSAEKAPSQTILIDGTKFTYPLINKWISEYTRINPDVKISIITKTASEQTDLSIIAHQPELDELTNNQDLIYTGKYALIPVTNDFNPQLSNFARKGLSKKEIDKLFFEVIDYDNDEPVQKSKFPAIIYSRDNKACTSATLAKYFGHSANEIRGKKVFGDEIYLISAIKKDSVALTYNTLSNIYDINTRKLKSGLAILPIDVKKEQKELFTANLDAVISLLENNQIESIPVEKIGFVINRNNTKKEVAEFLNWILTEGQKYNNAQGFLTLDKAQIAEQSNKLSVKLLTQN